MRRHVLIVAIAVCLAPPAGAQTAAMDCTVGPVTKTFGGSKWLVSSCSDDRTIDGRGKGDQQATEAAMTELAALSVADVRAMIAETKQLQKPR